jgi:hypothetical protein
MIIKKQILGTALGIVLIGAAATPSARAQEVFFDYSSSPLHFTVGTSAQAGQTLDTLFLPGSISVEVAIAQSFQGANYLQLFGSGAAGSFEFATQIHAPLNSYFSESLNPLQTWSDLGSHSETSWANISALTLSDGTGENIRSNPTYIPFWFLDAGDSNTKKYGFMTVDSYVTGSGAAAVLSLDILNYAYENSGTPIQMGTVPEPAMLALAGLGGLGMLLFRRRK